MLKRHVESVLYQELDNPKVLLLLGARQTGKTTLLKKIHAYLDKHEKTVFLITLEDPEILSILNHHPEGLFKIVPKDQQIAVLIDEIQYLANPSNFLKYIYDLYSPTIKLIVTGSSAFYIDQKFNDSLAGRKIIHHIYPLSFSEFLESKNEDSLIALIEKQISFPFQKRSFLLFETRRLRDYIDEYLTYGGYPDVVLSPTFEEKKLRLQELKDSFLKKDFLESRIKYEDKAVALLKILASQVGELVNTQELSNTLDISHSAIENYLYIFQKAFIIQLVRPYFKNIRKELTKMPKVFFYDMGFLNSLLNQFDPPQNRPDRGAVLENFVFQSLLYYPIQSVNFWRTQAKQEVDFIIDDHVAYECKWTAAMFKENRYKVFLAAYPAIPLNVITYADDLQINVLDVVR